MQPRLESVPRARRRKKKEKKKNTHAAAHTIASPRQRQANPASAFSHNLCLLVPL
jgi:hypothetical protein